nr:ribonuclease H-like domain-containing protein [Tanacetum cinerariifolium]
MDDILLVQVYVDDIIFGSTKRPLSTEFEQLLHKRFQMSSIRELTFFLRLQVDQRKDGIFLSQDKYVSDILKKFGFSSVKSASTPMETHKPLSKDAARTNTKIHVDNESAICVVKNHIYHSKTKHIEIRHHFIRDSDEKRLIEMVKIHTDYNVVDLLTKAFDVTRFQFLIASIVQKLMLLGSVTATVYICIGVAVRSFEERILDTYNGVQEWTRLTLKGYLINDGYADLVQHADKKELAISGKTETSKEFSNPLMAGSLPKTTLPTLLNTLKIKTINDNVRLQALIDGKKVVITEASIRHDLKLNDAEGTSCLPNAVIFEELARMGYAKISEKLTFYKAFFLSQWKFFIHTILQCLSSKTTSWNEFSSTMALTIIRLTNNQKFNFLKYILDTLKKILEVGPQRKHKPIRKEKKEKKETKVSPTELPIEKNVPTPSSDPLPSGEDSMPLKELMVLCTNLSNKVLDLENEVIEVKYSHKAKITELESRVEKLEEENRSLTNELKSSISKFESPVVKETVIDKEKSSKQVRKIADINDDAEVNMENVYNLDLAHEETILKVVKVITTANLIVNEVSTVGGELNATDEEPVSTAPTNITTAQPSEATKITVDISNAPKAHVKDKGKAKLVEEPKVLKSRKAQIAIDEEVARRIDAE